MFIETVLSTQEQLAVGNASRSMESRALLHRYCWTFTQIFFLMAFKLLNDRFRISHLDSLLSKPVHDFVLFGLLFWFICIECDWITVRKSFLIVLNIFVASFDLEILKCGRLKVAHKYKNYSNKLLLIIITAFLCFFLWLAISSQTSNREAILC